eukprot:5816872-Amphidinium_carterae.1
MLAGSEIFSLEMSKTEALTQAEALQSFFLIYAAHNELYARCTICLPCMGEILLVVIWNCAAYRFTTLGWFCFSLKAHQKGHIPCHTEKGLSPSGSLLETKYHPHTG